MSILECPIWREGEPICETQKCGHLGNIYHDGEVLCSHHFTQRLAPKIERQLPEVKPICKSCGDKAFDIGEPPRERKMAQRKPK